MDSQQNGDFYMKIEDNPEWYDLLFNKTEAENGDPEAQFNLALNLHSGMGFKPDREQAVYWLTKAAEQGQPQAMLTLGEFYLRGDGVEQNVDTAVYWLRKSAEHNNLQALDDLASCYYAGWGVEKDSGKSLEYLRKAAKLGYVTAFVHIWELKMEGVDIDEAEALGYLKMAAERKNPEAQYELGRYLSKTDVNESNKWYLAAAEQDYADTLKKHAWQFEYGWLGEQDLQKAQELHEQAAFLKSLIRQNHPDC